MRPLRGERLMIISNGAAPAALALDELWSRNGKLATLSEETLAQLRAVLPEYVNVGNPLDLRDDASNERYVSALTVLLESRGLRCPDGDPLTQCDSARQRKRAGADRRPEKSTHAESMSPS